MCVLRWAVTRGSRMKLKALLWTGGHGQSQKEKGAGTTGSKGKNGPCGKGSSGWRGEQTILPEPPKGSPALLTSAQWDGFGLLATRAVGR